jgi:putative peptidoglycan lipid II flippase
VDQLRGPADGVPDRAARRRARHDPAAEPVEGARRCRYARIFRAARLGLRVTFLLAAPSALALFFFATLTATLFNYGKFDAHTVTMVSRALATYGIGLVGIILIKILAPGFYAKQDIKTPVKIAIIVLIVTQISNYVFVPLIGHAGLTLSIGVGACLNSLLLFFGLRKRGIYQPSPGWLRFFVQLTGAALVLAGLMHWCAINFDWTGMRAQPLDRIALMAACLVLFAALYFGMLWVMGFKYAYFKGAPSDHRNDPRP